MSFLKKLATAAALATLVASSPAVAEQPDLKWFSPTTDAKTTSGTYTKDGPWTIALVFPDLSNSWRVQAVEEVRSAAAADPRIKELIVTNFKEDVSLMISDMEDMISRGVDAIIIHPSQAGLIGDQVEAANAKGIPVINFGQMDDEVSYPVQMWTGGAAFGAVGGAWLRETLGGKGRIWALRGLTGHGEEQARYEGMLAELKGTEIEIVREDFGQWSYEGAKPVCESWALSGDIADAVWSSGADMTRACVDVFLELGLPLIPMTGEGNNGFLRQWHDNGLQSVAASFPPSMFAVGLNVAAALLEGESLNQRYWASPAPITNENLNEFYVATANDNLWVPTTLPDARINELFPR